MNGPEPELLELVVVITRELPTTTVAVLAATLETAQDWQEAGMRGSALLHATALNHWQGLHRAATACPWCTPTRLAALLRGAVATDEAWRGKIALDVAWTGPAPPLSTLRRTEQALLDLIAAARRDLWVVTFAAYKIPGVCAALVAAASRGCQVRLLLESESESQGKLSFGGVDEMPGEVRKCCEVYVWPHENRPTDDRGRHGTLHAKCAVADGELLFVGSANLTEFAFDLNIELGLLARHREAAGVVERQLRWLVESGTMSRL